MQTMPGKIVALSAFVAFIAISIVGMANQYADFKLEWFFPADSYVQDYFDMADEHFSQGTRVSVYLRDFGGLSESQVFKCAQDVENYLESSSYFDQANQRASWFAQMSTWHTSTYGSALSSTGFYAKLKTFQTQSGSQNMAFKDANAPTQGLSKLRFSNGIVRKHLTTTGTDRWDTMEAMRREIKATCSVAFPFGFEFLWWEEVGYIGAEFVRNATICLGAILVIVFLMIPELKVNIPVILSILATVADVIGFFYWWGETINGVICIYTVICIGLAVDYSAHIGHIFRLSSAEGADAEQRAIDTMERIGTSVTHALLSTLLAVVVLAPSKSFVFSVFFKVLFLVVMFGFLNAIVVLPVLLSLFNGGSMKPAKAPQAISDA